MNQIEDEYGRGPMCAEPVDDIVVPNWSDHPYEINIKTLHRGWVVGVGCKTFAFTDRYEMMKHIDAYLSNPKEVTELFNNNKLF